MSRHAAKREARINRIVGKRERERAELLAPTIAFYDREIAWLKWVTEEIAAGRGPKWAAAEIAAGRSPLHAEPTL